MALPVGLLQTIPLVMKGIGGAAQLIQADNLGPGVIPDYNIPESERIQLQILQNQANQGLPGQSLSLLSDRISGSQASSLNTVLRTGAGVNSIPQLTDVTNRAFSSLILDDINARRLNRNDYIRGLQRFTDFEEKEFEFNEVNPAIVQRNKYEQLRRSGLANLTGAVDSAVATAINAQTSDIYKNALREAQRTNTFLSAENGGNLTTSLPDASLLGEAEADASVLRDIEELLEQEALAGSEFSLIDSLIN